MGGMAEETPPRPYSTTSEDSPMITLHGRPLIEDKQNYSNSMTPRVLFPESPRVRELKRSPRSSPRSSPRKSKVPPSPPPPVSRLPVAQTRFTVKSLRLPPLDESPAVDNSIRVTPEKLMEELRTRIVREKLLIIEDDEISFKFRYKLNDDNRSDTSTIINSENSRPRMSLRNRDSIVVDAPDLIYEDPLDVARQTLQNTRANSGYRQCKLVYTTERRLPRPSSPEPAFSKKTGISRHFIKNICCENDEEQETINDEELKLRFDRVLQLFDSPVQFEDEFDEENVLELLHKQPDRSCLKKPPTRTPLDEQKVSKTRIVEIKRISYEGEVEDERFVQQQRVDEDSEPSRKRKLNGAKRLKRID